MKEDKTMFKVVDQWGCVIKEFTDRDDALAYIAFRNSLYAGRPSTSPQFYIQEAE